MKEIRRMDVLSVGIMYGMTLAFMGLLIGLLMASIGSLFGELSGASGLANFGSLAIIVFPILYGGLGFVFGLIGALLYNLFAGWVGGIKIELKDTTAN
jgi:hypothetical protein